MTQFEFVRSLSAAPIERLPLLITIVSYCNDIHDTKTLAFYHFIVDPNWKITMALSLGNINQREIMNTRELNFTIR